MTIELAPKAAPEHKPKAQSGHKTDTKVANKTDSKTANASASSDKAVTNAGEGAEGAANAAGGFLAILASLGDATQTGLAEAATDGSLTVTDGSALSDAVLPGDDTSAAAPGTAVDASSLLAQTMQAQTATVPSAEAAAEAAKAQTDPARNALAAALANANGNKPAGFVDASQGAGGAEGATRLLQRGNGHAAANGLAQSEKNPLAASPADTGAAPATASTKAEAQPAFDFKMFTAMQEARGVPEKTQPTVALSGLVKPEKSSADRVESARTSSDTTYSAAPLGMSSNSGYSANATGDVAPAPDLQAAEQVKYWISQDVQNAELKLDGLGDKPVEVSISLNGNEAHVAFRTDEQQTRGVLESAGAHLKDMLAREGLVLSGVSVGTSGTNGGDGGERKPRQGVRQSLVTAAPVGAVDAGPRTRVPAGRALDLFV